MLNNAGSWPSKSTFIVGNLNGCNLKIVSFEPVF